MKDYGYPWGTEEDIDRIEVAREFMYLGKTYRFVFDFNTDDPSEGATLTYVGDENGRLRPSVDADPEAWDIANKLVGL